MCGVRRVWWGVGVVKQAGSAERQRCQPPQETGQQRCLRQSLSCRRAAAVRPRTEVVR